MNKRIMTLIMLLVAIAMGTKVMAANEEAYAVYTSGDRTLAFYYDDKKSQREGDKYGVNNGYLIPGWIYDGKQFEKVVFSGSFASYRPTSTNQWFSGQTELKTITNIKNLKTDKVTTMNSMFYQCSRLKEVDVSGFNTSSVTDMGSMFSECHQLTTLDVSGWDTSNVTNMLSMFSKCHQLTTLDVSGWDTRNVTRIGFMFYKCSSLTNLDVSHWDTKQLTNMCETFYECKNLSSLDLSSFNTEKVTTMYGLFSNCQSLETIFAGAEWIISDETDTDFMFNTCPNLRGSAGTTYDPNHIDGTYAHIDGGQSNPGYFSVREYSLWVGGTEVTSVNYESLPVMSGSASYDIANKTLTLTNAIINVNAQGGYCIGNGLSAEQRVQGIDGLKIEVIGQCQLNGSDIALMINGNTTLTGTGRLSLNGTNTIWIEEGKGLTVAVKDFHATATQEVIYGDYGSLTVDGTKINSFVCEPKTPNWRYITIRGVFMTMNDCHFADPEGPWSSGDVEEFNYWDGYYMRYGTKQYCGKVVIEPDSRPVNYRLWVGGTRVTSANKDAISVASGTASYDPATYTLTLNNATIDAGGSDGISNGLPNLEGMADFKIVCKGTNNSIDAVNSDGYGLALYGNTTISGSRLGISAYNKGIFADKDVTLTFKDADIYIEAVSPVYSQNGVVNVNHSRLEALPTSLNERISAVSDAKAFNMTSCVFADQGDGIDPEDLYYDTDEQMREICYTGAPYHGRIVIVPTGVSIATGLEEIDNGQWTMDNSESLYNLHGQRVSHPVKGQIYIQNGRKVKF